MSECCSALGKKTQLVRPPGIRPTDPSTYGDGHLGKFRCSQCNKTGKKFSRVTNTEGVKLAG